MILYSVSPLGWTLSACISCRRRNIGEHMADMSGLRPDFSPQATQSLHKASNQSERALNGCSFGRTWTVSCAKDQWREDSASCRACMLHARAGLTQQSRSEFLRLSWISKRGHGSLQALLSDLHERAVLRAEAVPTSTYTQVCEQPQAQQHSACRASAGQASQCHSACMESTPPCCICVDR